MTDIQHIAAASRDYTDFDAVIVGSGPSGSIVARTLAEKGCQVAVLEYGGLVSPAPSTGLIKRPIAGHSPQTVPPTATLDSVLRRRRNAIL
ncbi:NAD(P)-binding protein [Sinorhizobium psoraleae]|uniref:NAD(P)-binding protein n=1 Tax=Sinorhizobium psoraleae TaxID=520838 RepID=UPI0035E3D920